MLKHGAELQKLPWLIRLRWGAILGELFVFALALWPLDISLPIYPIGGLLFLQALSNLFLMWRARAEQEVSTLGFFSIFVLDQIFLTSILYYSGGHTNPFSAMYLLQIVCAAILLRGRETWTLVALSVLCYSSLFFWNTPIQELSGHHHHHGAAPTFNLHLNGMLVAFVLLAILLAYFITKLSRMLERQAAEIVRLRQKSADEQKLLALTTLAAGAAHELGSPLGTIAVATHEIALSVKEFPEIESKLQEDLDLVAEEIQRCQTILAAMSSQAGEHAGEEPQVCLLADILQDLLRRLPENDRSRVVFRVAEGLKQVKIFKEAFLSSTSSLMKNSLESGGAKPVEMICEQEKDALIIRVIDQGEGMTDEVLARIGEPFFSTKPEGKGMGLGIFLTKLFIERLHGVFEVRSAHGKGTTVEFRLPGVVGGASFL